MMWLVSTAPTQASSERLSGARHWLLTPSPRMGEPASWTLLRRAVLLLTTVLTFGTGLYRIGDVSPWADEAVTVTVMHRSWSQLFLLWGGADAPLIPYYVIAKLWVSALPWLSTLVALRVLSAVAAALTVSFTVALVTRRAGTAVALISAAVLMSLPGLSRFAQEARPSALLLLAATASWFAWDTWRRPTDRPAASAGADDHRPGVRRTIVDALGYVISLASTALIHLFGLFQWPAQVIADLTTPGQTARARVRRALGSIAAMAVALAVVGVPVAIAALRGTGPAKSAPVTARLLLSTLNKAVLWSGSWPRATVVFAAAAFVVLLWIFRAKVLRRDADLVRISVIWLGVPLFLAVATAFVKPSLLRPRYWLPLLPPLAVLAGVGLFAAARIAYGLTHKALMGRGTAARRSTAAATVVAMVAVLVPLAGHAWAVLPVHSSIRAQKGHGMSMTPALKRVDAMLAEEPDLPVLVSPGTRTLLVVAMRPDLTDRNALFLQDPNRPTVWPIKQSAASVAEQLAGHDRAIWLHSEPGAPKPTAPPKALQAAGFELDSIERVGSWWFSILVR